MKHIKSIAAALTVISVTGGAAAQADENPVVVELFTSQGCYSCPPAEKFLGELAGRKDVVALEWHVDYWDSLVYGFHGKWKDPYSAADHTRRQQVYNIAIRNRSGVYTPQMVIDGHAEAVGSRSSVVNNHIQKLKKNPKLRVSVSGSPRPQATISGDTGAGAEIFLVKFINEAVTRVKTGENHGKTLKSHHIVRAMQKLGDWRGTKMEIALPGDAIGDNMSCAVLVQERNQGRIIGAGLCPKDAQSS